MNFDDTEVKKYMATSAIEEVYPDYGYDKYDDLVVTSASSSVNDDAMSNVTNELKDVYVENNTVLEADYPDNIIDGSWESVWSDNVDHPRLFKINLNSYEGCKLIKYFKQHHSILKYATEYDNYLFFTDKELSFVKDALNNIIN